METMNARRRMLWGIIFVVIHAVAYVLCRYVFFDLHGMKQWPDILAVVALVVIVAAAIGGNRMIAGSAVIGYLGGFVLAMVFRTHGVDPGGGATSNAWIIWTLALLVSILTGVAVSVIVRIVRAKRRKDA